jgi:dCMP deaminase
MSMILGARQRKWDDRYLGLAQDISTWSKDPSTKVGAVIVNSNNRIIATGFNGFAPGENDDPALYADRGYKYQHVVHAEDSAIRTCDERDLYGATLYTSFPCCPNCMRMVRNRRFHRVVCRPLPTEGKSIDWVNQWRGWIAESIHIAAGSRIVFNFVDQE